jgi:hypothetical protein
MLVIIEDVRYDGQERLTMSDKRPEISSHNTMPCRTFALVELLLLVSATRGRESGTNSLFDVLSNVLFDIKL